MKSICLAAALLVCSCTRYDDQKYTCAVWTRLGFVVFVTPEGEVVNVANGYVIDARKEGLRPLCIIDQF